MTVTRFNSCNIIWRISEIKSNLCRYNSVFFALVTKLTQVIFTPCIYFTVFIKCNSKSFACSYLRKGLIAVHKNSYFNSCLSAAAWYDNLCLTCWYRLDCQATYRCNVSVYWTCAEVYTWICILYYIEELIINRIDNWCFTLMKCYKIFIKWNIIFTCLCRNKFICFCIWRLTCRTVTDLTKVTCTPCIYISVC